MKRTSRALVSLALLAWGAAIGTAQPAGQGYLKTHVNPGRAGVFVDGKYLGPAANFRMAQKYALAPGEHELKLSDPRFEEVTQKITITAGKTTSVKQALKELPLAKPPFGELRVVGAGKFDAVYLNDRFYGHADEFSSFAQRLLLPPGEYTVKVVSSGGTAHEEKVKLETGKTTVVAVK